MKNLLFPIVQRAVVRHETSPEFKWTINVNSFYGRKNYVVNLDMLKEVRKVLGGRRTKSIPNGSSVYFTKSVTFSRLRFREWAKDKDINIVRDPERADVIVADVSYYNKILKHREIERTFTGYIGLNAGIFYLDIAYHSRPFLESHGSELIGQETWLIDGANLTQAEVEAINQFQVLPYVTGKILSFKDLKKTVFDENLDGDTLDWIREMLGSDEQDNIDLGVEMLGNFSFIHNEHVITDIFVKYQHKITNSHLAKSVKFSHLREKFEMFSNTTYQATYGLPFERKFLFFKKLNILNLLSREEIQEGIRTILQEQVKLFEGPVNSMLGRDSVRLSEIKLELKRNDTVESYSFEINKND